MNALFVCSRNQWRSPTAEEIYKQRDGINARSRGTNRSARRKVTLQDIQWAERIFVMESQHKQRLLANFRLAISPHGIHVLDIPDQYLFMDPELVAMIQSAVDPLLAN
ncbi:low molecular weight protein tyrosine phosphatase family protein [Planctomycetes bacterium K23_9]|uniref:Protein-tyrosine-phosphatase n=1 Tax=Stieleria marina TaxID=1930275 RepID=A0A517P035_9BACT|nr:hypothetical protein K239x_47500 [Planctomycetes bacterium K23_9]